MSTNLAFLLANERTGTHYLRSSLESTGKVIAPGELCNAQAESNEPIEHSFLRFRAMYTFNGGEYIPQTNVNTFDMLESYFASLRLRLNFDNAKHVICDVKYSHLHNFNCFWWGFLSKPLLIEFALHYRMPIVHLVRRNVYCTAFSQLYATASGSWKREAGQELNKFKMHINRDALLHVGSRIQKTTELVRNWLVDAESYESAYEDIVGEQRKENLNKIMNFLGLERCNSFASHFKKTTGRYSEVVENFEEIRDLLEP